MVDEKAHRIGALFGLISPYHIDPGFYGPGKVHV